MRDGIPKGRLSRLDPTQRYSARVVLFGLAIALVAIPFATLLFQVIAEGPLVRLDGSLANRLNAAVHERRGVVPVLRAVSWLGGPPWLVFVGVVVGVYVLRRGRVRACWFLAVTCLGGSIINTAVKLAVNRPRPEVDHEIATAFGKSFPSGHSMSSTVVYGAVLLVLLPAVRTRRHRHMAVGIAIALVLAIGSTRLLLGVHFVSDVVGGFTLGLAWLSASVAAWELYREDIGKRRTEPLEEGIDPESGPALRP
jgi:membrane-associated phospholipid phosphatase